MKSIKSMLPYLLVIVMDFYLLPFLIRNTGTAILMLLLVIPVICFACSLFYGIKHSFHIMFPAIVAILFLPTIFIFFNSSAWVYIVAYGVIALSGNVVGMMISKSKNRGLCVKNTNRVIIALCCLAILFFLGGFYICTISADKVFVGISVTGIGMILALCVAIPTIKLHRRQNEQLENRIKKLENDIEVLKRNNISK